MKLHHSCTGRPAGALAAILMLLLPACGFPQQTAPAAATLAISANPLAIDLDGDASEITVIIARENGSPAVDGTVVTFTTTLGAIPATAETANGVARVLLRSTDRSGVAVVRAQSGTADQSAEVEIVVGPTVGSVAATADPVTLPPGGGRSRITVLVLNPELQPAVGVPVVFSTTSGQLSQGIDETNASGQARVSLQTADSAVVTATVGTLTTSVLIEVSQLNNAAPTADITTSPSNPEVGTRVTFNGSGSTDSDGRIVLYEWDFGDGGRATGKRAEHAYGSPGNYTVLLVVTDDLGATGSDTATVSIAGEGPVASFTFSPGAPASGASVTFDAAPSFDPDGTIVEYSWSWGDGTSPSVSASRTATHSFAAAGTYTVTLTVRDNDNETSTASATVTVS
jgi:PKD repeat protein